MSSRGLLLTDEWHAGYMLLSVAMVHSVKCDQKKGEKN